jgi:Ca2+-binding RTX toxin-like protein
MATLVLYTPYDFSVSHGTGWSVSDLSATSFTLNGPGQETQILSGDFGLDANGALQGTVYAIDDYVGDQPVYSFSDLYADAAQLLQLVHAQGETPLLFSQLLQYDDFIQGSAGNDVILGYGGNDAIDGGGGDVTVAFRGNRADYAVSYDPLYDVFYVVDKVANRDGTQQIANVNNFRFNDGLFTYDFLSSTSPPPSDTPPEITAFSPAPDAIEVPVNSNIVVTFSEPIVLGSGFIVLSDEFGNPVETYTAASTTNLRVSGNTLTIHPSVPFADGAGYSLDFYTDAVHDLSGNQFDGSWGYYFVTLGTGAVINGSDGTTLSADNGNDTLICGAGSETVQGGSGDDVMHGGSGNDLMVGGSGTCVFISGAGEDTMDGGSGSNVYYVNSAGDLVVAFESRAEQLDPGGTHQADVGRSLDKVIASINYTLTAFVENLSLAAAAGNLSGTGNELNNVITGNEGNNVLTGGPGNDTIDGGSGTNTSVYFGNFSDYTITIGAGTSAKTVITDNRKLPNNDGTDNLTNIQRLQFADERLALDLGVDQAAGKAVLTMAATLGPAFASDKGWAGRFLAYFDTGAKVADGTNLLISAGIMAAFAGSSDNASLVKFVYNNVNGKPPDATTLASLLAPLNAHTTTPAEWMASMVESAANQAHVQLTGLAHTGWQYIVQ